MIYTPHNSGLGDAIATINLLARKASVSGPVQLARRDRGALHDELFGVFHPTRILTAYGDGDTLLSGFDCWAAPVWPTKTRWTEFQSHPFYTTQFDGISSPEKNPSPEDIARIGASVPLPGISLGKHTPIAVAVDLLANSAFFVGCDSGMSHLAHAVGTPTFILEYGLPIVTTHRNKPHIPCAGAGDFIDWKLPTWANYRKFIGTGL